MMIVKGRNRDTAWFAAIDNEWPALKTAFEHYLDKKNFDEEGPAGDFSKFPHRSIAA